jgi:hypothetical protein
MNRTTSQRAGTAPRAGLVLLVFVLAIAGVGCPCIRGPINASETARWYLFAAFGANKICPELLKRGVPVRTTAIGSRGAIGRFFPQQCRVEVDHASRTMRVQVAGLGYSYVPIVKRVGFSADVIVVYKPDFRLEKDSVYVWGRFAGMVRNPELRIIGVENPVANLATQIPALGNLATVLGQGLLMNEIGRGFTVVRSDDGDDFAMEILSPPNKPARPTDPDERFTFLAADTTEIHSNSRDFLGPFAVEASGKALRLRAHVEGAPVTLTLVDKTTGDLWMQSYLQGAALLPPPGPVSFWGTASPGDSGRGTALGKGSYYVVVENAQRPTAPLGIPLPIPLPLPIPGVSDPTSLVTYSVDLGDVP